MAGGGSGAVTSRRLLLDNAVRVPVDAPLPMLVAYMDEPGMPMITPDPSLIPPS